MATTEFNDSVPLENRITQEVIDNLVRPVFVSITDEAITEYVYMYCKHLLKYSMERHESKEIAYAINLNTLDFVGAAFGNSRSVDVEELIAKMDDSEYVFIILHNHPSNSTFSPKDLSTFFEAVNVSILVVIGNDGGIYVIEKTKAISESDYLDVKRYLVAYRKGVADFEDTAEKLKRFGVVYSSF